MTGFDQRTEALAKLLQRANAGDAACYRLFLEQLAPLVRGMARRGIGRIGTPLADLEDAVQETLLAIHLKRHTWREDQPIGPWIGAITRHKLIDLARKHGRRKEIELDETFEQAAAEPADPTLSDQEMNRLLESVSETQRLIIRSISINGVSIREVAAKLMMTEGAVRVALHRGLKALAEAYRRVEL
jgi:RNA polymerase sigma-70 factor (ECF subfamily)